MKFSLPAVGESRLQEIGVAAFPEHPQQQPQTAPLERDPGTADQGNRHVPIPSSETPLS